MIRRDHAHQDPWEHEDRRAKLVALAVTVGIHLVCVVVLLRATGGRPFEDAAQDENAIEIIFIDRPSVPYQVTKTHTVNAVRRHTVMRRRSPKLGSRAKTLSASNDLPDVASSTSATRLNLAIAPAEIDFRRNLFERPARPLGATTDRLQVHVLDTSLGGRLQAMTQRRICGEFRSALARKRESTTSIMNAMQRRGCAI